VEVVPELAVALKPGTRFRSVTCTTEVIVVRGSDDADLRCGGEPMVDAASDAPPVGEPAAPFDEGTLIGKRYATEDEGIELLCTKAGAGSLSLGLTPLPVKGAKPLPASD
jgi:hypothetical protein